MRKYASHLGRRLNSDQSGVILIWLIFILVVAGILGSSTVYLTTSSTYDELLANNQAKAYYMAEAGGQYVIPIMLQNSTAAFNNINGNTFTLSNGEQFIISDMNISNNPMTVVSTGIVNAGSWLEGRRKITYGIEKTTYDEDFTNDNNWIDPGNNADIFSDELVDGDPAFRIHKTNLTEGATLSFNWDDESLGLPDLAEIQSQSGGFLSYELQIKSMINFQGSKGYHFMVGLSFRLDSTAQNTYGISFFKSDHNDDPPPAWVTSTFDLVRNNKVYIVLWKEVSNVITLLDYKLLEVVDGVVNNDDPDKLSIKDWSTLVVRVIEIDDGTRRNKISGFFQDQFDYSRGTISWNPNPFNEVTWVVKGSQTVEDVEDPRFTTENFGTIRPPEIGIHAFYDHVNSNDIFFDDFAMRTLNEGNPRIRPIQY